MPKKRKQQPLTDLQNRCLAEMAAAERSDTWSDHNRGIENSLMKRGLVLYDQEHHRRLLTMAGWDAVDEGLMQAVLRRWARQAYRAVERLERQKEDMRVREDRLRQTLQEMSDEQRNNISREYTASQRQKKEVSCHRHGITAAYGPRDDLRCLQCAKAAKAARLQHSPGERC